MSIENIMGYMCSDYVEQLDGKIIDSRLRLKEDLGDFHEVYQDMTTGQEYVIFDYKGINEFIFKVVGYE